MPNSSGLQTDGPGNWPADWIAFLGPLAIFLALPLLPFLTLLPNGDAFFLPLSGPGLVQSYFLKIAAFSVLCAYLAARILGRIGQLRLDVPWLALGCGTFFIALSAVLAPIPSYSLDTTLLWFAGAALFILLRAGYRRFDIFKPYSWIFVLQGGILAVYGIAQFRGHEILPYSENIQKNQVIATFGHPNYFASFAGPTLFICLARLFAPGWILGRLLALLVIPFLAYTLFLMRSRGVWIGSFLGLCAIAIAFIVSYRSIFLASLRRWWGRLALSMAIVALIAGIFAAGPAELERAAERRLVSLIAGSQWESRLYYWYAAIRMNSPLSPRGIGAGEFGKRFWDEIDEHQKSADGRYFRRNLVSLTAAGKALDPGNVHNDYLEMWVESGPGALFAHLLLAGYLLYFFSLRLMRMGGAPPFRRGVFLSRACLLGAYVCVLFDAVLGFPLALPCSLAVFWFLSALLNQYIDIPER